MEGNRIARVGHRHRVGAQHRHPGKGRHHCLQRIGHGNAQEAFLSSQARIIAGDAVMVGIANRDQPDTGGAGQPNRFLHGANRDQLAHAAIPVNNCRYRGGKNHLRLCRHIDEPAANLFVIQHNPIGAMRINAIQICRQQHIRDLLTLCRFKAKPVESLLTECL
ncbi:hypothetical protein SDC9_134606 [bioreactor metagenome]|uniref:Uncharacterized protein n=1 Tax=bioreactor metagenome TaxID=1076179 RepID=A0A645DDE4_9ZZZZ